MTSFWPPGLVPPPDPDFSGRQGASPFFLPKIDKTPPPDTLKRDFLNYTGRVSMSEEVVSRLVIDYDDKWFFALCALAGIKSGKETRGSILIPNAKSIAATLLELRGKGLIELHITPRRDVAGSFSDDIAGWFSMINTLRPEFYIRQDKYESAYLNISDAVRELFIDVLMGQLRFFEETERDRVFAVAKAIGSQAHDLLLFLGARLRKRMWETIRTTENKNDLMTLVPLACHTFTVEDQIFMPEFVNLLSEHRRRCCYCREAFFQKLGPKWEEECLANR
ncbi:MAG: hypothetical protein HY506_01075 [Candidatus Yanofskybacteria bacterium]|nr:hypothetical protein [Candidatus Yanofskybacteria bacterium]